MAYQRKDRFYKKAKETGFRSRAAFKLIEMNKKFKLLKPGAMVIDLGCWPGSWIQVISKEIAPSGQVIGIDLETMPPSQERNVILIQGDIREELTGQRVLAALGRKVDLIVSDMAPNLSGIKFQDHYNSYELAEQALKFCHMILREGGNFVVKIFPGEELNHFQNNLKNAFSDVKIFSPEATRKTSTEIYFVAKNFHGKSTLKNI